MPRKCYCSRCSGCCSKLWGFMKRGLFLLLLQLIGWFLFAYVDDDLNLFECAKNGGKKLARQDPEVQKYTRFFENLQNKTNRSLTLIEKRDMYLTFQTFFKAPSTQAPIDGEKIWIGKKCFKWYRFSVMTMTSIGFGAVTPKTDAGKLLLIPYALLTIPIMASFLSYTGSILVGWTESLMVFIHRRFKKHQPLKYKSIKETFYLFILMLLIIFLAIINVSGYSFFSSYLDAFYFFVVTYTTIGYGDITDPADTQEFYGVELMFGLSVVSSLVDAFLGLAAKFELRCGRRQNCLCCTYSEDEINVEPSADLNVESEMNEVQQYQEDKIVDIRKEKEEPA